MSNLWWVACFEIARIARRLERVPVDMHDSDAVHDWVGALAAGLSEAAKLQRLAWLGTSAALLTGIAADAWEQAHALLVRLHESERGPILIALDRDRADWLEATAAVADAYHVTPDAVLELLALVAAAMQAGSVIRSTAATRLLEALQPKD